MTVTPRQIIAFRLGRSGLRRRTGELLAAGRLELKLEPLPVGQLLSWNA